MTSRPCEEVWREIPGLRDYEVSSHGRVRSFRALGPGARRATHPRPIATWLREGYPAVTLQVGPGKRRALNIHILVAAAFLGPRPEGHQVAHNDGDKLNNRVDNLRYATPTENAHDKRVHGTDILGERNGRHKITAAQVHEICALYRTGLLQREIGELFGIAQAHVSSIIRGQSWSHLEREAS